MKLLIVGCGYVGKALVEHLRQLPNQSYTNIFALTRSDARVSELQRLGVTPLVGNWLDPLSLREMPQVDHILVSVPHRESEELGTETHITGLKNLCHCIDTGLQKLIYLSTTGVYGDCQDEAVSETTPVAPTRIGPQIAVAAENWLREFDANFETITLRLAGIYGPGRVPLAAKVRAGEALAVPKLGHLNLVHVDDIARIITAMLTHAMQDSLYVLSDGIPVHRETFYRELARQCGVEEPQFIEPEEDSSRARRATDKRVDPTRLISELKYQFLFPDFKAGLAQTLREGEQA